LREKRKRRTRKEQAGVALLLAIFILLLVAVVGLAMMAASGTETSLTANYRSSTSAYYAALSGLEEGRGRLLPRNPNYLNCCLPTLPLGQVIYITNPLASDPVPSDPTNYGNAAAYPDTEYAQEFRRAFNPPSSIVKTPSVQSLPGFANPLYKWVRINAIDEEAILVDVNNTDPGPPDSFWFTQLNFVQPIYFDGKNLTRVVTPYQALAVTALAALPDKSTKLLQYVVGPVALQIPISAALTIAGPGLVADAAVFNQPSMPNYTFSIYGDDQATGDNGGLTCPAKPSLPAIGVFNHADYVNVHDNKLLTPQPGNYTGGGVAIPSVSPSPYVHPSNSTVDMTDPISLSIFLPIVRNAADAVLNGPRTEADMPSAMSATNPMTVYVNGDLSLNSFTGYGLLVVRGNFTYTGDSGWKGIVIVLGGTITVTNAPGSNGEFDGAVYLANLTTGGGGAAFGEATYNVANHAGKGIYYDSCWVSAALKPFTYKVISFREIPYP